MKTLSLIRTIRIGTYAFWVGRFVCFQKDLKIWQRKSCNEDGNDYLFLKRQNISLTVESTRAKGPCLSSPACSRFVQIVRNWMCWSMHIDFMIGKLFFLGRMAEKTLIWKTWIERCTNINIQSKKMTLFCTWIPSLCMYVSSFTCEHWSTIVLQNSMNFFLQIVLKLQCNYRVFFLTGPPLNLLAGK